MPWGVSKTIHLLEASQQRRVWEVPSDYIIAKRKVLEVRRRVAGGWGMRQEGGGGRGLGMEVIGHGLEESLTSDE